jgi:hypothetical protein
MLSSELGRWIDRKTERRRWEGIECGRRKNRRWEVRKLRRSEDVEFGIRKVDRQEDREKKLGRN